MPRATAFTRVLRNGSVLDTRRFCRILVAQEMRAAIATVIRKGSSCFLSRGATENNQQGRIVRERSKIAVMVVTSSADRPKFTRNALGTELHLRELRVLR